MSNSFDFNNDGEQKSFDVIPANEIVTLQLTVRPGASGEGGWLTKSSDGGSEGLDCEFTVVDGKYAKKKLWQRLTLQGTTEGHATAGGISRSLLKAVLESARGIAPDDKSEAAQKARKVESWGDFNNLRFVARIGVKPAKDGYAAKNTIMEVVTPDRKTWKKPEQVAPGAVAPSAGAASAAPPKNAIARPQWAE